MTRHAPNLASRLVPIAAGIAAGGLLWALLPVAKTLTQALVDAGFPANWAGLVILGLFVSGGVEGALLLAPAARTWRRNRAATGPDAD